MMIRAELWDLWPQGSNPCRNMRRYRTKPRERFLSLDELKRLGFVLDHTEDRQAAVVVRLLLFTGARSSEIAGLRWDWIRDTRAVLPDSMSGPTTRALRPDPPADPDRRAALRSAQPRMAQDRRAVAGRRERASRRLEDRPAHPVVRAGRGEDSRGAAPAGRRGAGISRGPYFGAALRLLGHGAGGGRAPRPPHSRRPPYLSVAGRHSRRRADRGGQAARAPQARHHRDLRPTRRCSASRRRRPCRNSHRPRHGLQGRATARTRRYRRREIGRNTAEAGSGGQGQKLPLSSMTRSKRTTQPISYKYSVAIPAQSAADARVARRTA